MERLHGCPHFLFQVEHDCTGAGLSIEENSNFVNIFDQELKNDLDRFRSQAKCTCGTYTIRAVVYRRIVRLVENPYGCPT